MMRLAAVLFAYAGMAALCVSMAKHQRETLDRVLKVHEQRALKMGGSILLALAYVLASLGHGWNIGPVAWVGAIILGGLAVGLALPYRPRWTPRAAGGAATLACLLVLGAIVR